jgi:hypothetical protein
MLFLIQLRQVKKAFGILIMGQFLLLGCKDLKPSNLNSLTARKSDTLLIRDIDKISDPFLFGDKPLKHLLQVDWTPSVIEVTENIDSVLNNNGEFIQETIGSTYQIRYGEDYFAMYRRADSVEFFITTELTSNRFANKWGVKIEMTKEEVIGKLNEFKIDRIPTTLIIGDMNNTFIQFDFEKDKLKKIKYDYYLD